MVVFSVAIIILVTAPSFAQPEKAQEGRSVATEQASDNAIFNRITDWFATRGKSPEEAETIGTQRQAERDAAKSRRKAARQKKEMERGAENAQQRIRGRAER